MVATVTASKLEDIMQQMAHQMGTELKADCTEICLDLPNEIGVGGIMGVDFEDGMAMMIFDCRFEEPFEVVVKNNQPDLLKLSFVLEGSCTYELPEFKTKGTVSDLETLFLCNEQGKELILQYPADTKIHYTSLLIDRSMYIEKIECNLDSVPDELNKVLKNTQPAEPFVYHTLYTTDVAESASELKLKYPQYEGLVRQTFFQSKGLEMFAHFLQAYADDQRPAAERVLLRQADLDAIKEARNILVDDITNPPTIAQLARQVGLNENKLKKGFKQLFGTTIHSFLLEVRMQQAKLLLAEGRLAISEVADQVGYKNKSHFSAKFRAIYGFLPRDFRKHLRSSAINMTEEIKK